jgi:hypothetical protein
MLNQSSTNAGTSNTAGWTLVPANGIATDVAGAATGEQQSHAIERSLRLPAGNYVVYAQQAVTNNAVTLRLDDWHMAVEISA